MKFKINWKQGILYFILIQAEIIAVSFLIGGVINIIVGFFLDLGPSKEFATAFIILLLDIIIKFFIFLPFFNDDRHFTFSQFCLNYTVTFILRFLISIISSFSAFTAGTAISGLGITIASLTVNPSIIMPQQVPKYIYILIFIITEALTVFTVFCSSMISRYIRAKRKKEFQANNQ